MANSSTKLLRAGAHFGDVRHLREVAGLILAESRYAPHLTTPLHAHEAASLTLVIRGGYRERFPTRTFDCVPGKILFRPPGQPHSDQMSNGGAHCLMVEFPQSWQERLHQAGFKIKGASQLPGVFHAVAQLRRELDTNDDATPLAVESLVLDLICSCMRQKLNTNSKPMWITRLHDRLESEFERRISLSELAGECGHHPAHVARTFRAHYHCTIGEFVRRRRIAHACERIAAGDPLSSVALDAGFANQSHFSRVFKTIIGTTPREYRECSRKD